MTHLEELVNNDSVQEKYAQIKDFFNKSEYAKYLMSFREQEKEDDPVKAVRRI